MDSHNVRIGLEIHVELATKSKIFCGCSTTFGAPPNSQCCPICLGLPGTLPILNQAAVEYAIRAALALQCEINAHSVFARKNYFYPDLPKAFQITQHDKPLAENGVVEYYLDGKIVQTPITRLHLEEEAGKSIHSGDSIVGSDYTFIDYNRAGIPLIEIVTAPDLTSPAQARAFLEQLRLVLQYAGVSDCKMENGSLRCDANISIEQDGQLGQKVEIKNLNSFRGLERALTYEAERQARLLSQGEAILPETRTWNERAQRTVKMRLKAGAPDYRYFPEPDLPPLELEQVWIREIAQSLPELPLARMERFQKELGLSQYDAGVLVRSPELSDVFEETVKLGHDPKLVVNWVTGEFSRLARQGQLISPVQLGELLELIGSGEISNSQGKTVLEELFAHGGSAREIIERRGFTLIQDESVLQNAVEQVLCKHHGLVDRYLAGEERLFGFFMGQVMAQTRGQAEPGVVKKLLVSLLKSGRNWEPREE